MKHPSTTFNNETVVLSDEQAQNAIRNINTRAMALIRHLSTIPDADGTIPAVEVMFESHRKGDRNEAEH